MNGLLHSWALFLCAGISLSSLCVCGRGVFCNMLLKIQQIREIKYSNDSFRLDSRLQTKSRLRFVLPLMLDTES